MNTGSKIVVYSALTANVAIAIGKFAAAAFSGSSAMWSEGVHSLVDSINELLLLYGIRRAAIKPSPKHPLGHGRELYFWSFVVAILVLALGAGLSFYEGFAHWRNPRPLEHHWWTYAVLAMAFVFEGISWLVSLREFRAQRGQMGYFEAFEKSKDPTTFTVLLEDSAALIGLMIAALGVGCAQLLHEPRFDAAASIGIALILTITSMLLARESKSLLIGEAAHPYVRDSIVNIARSEQGIRHVNGVMTVQMGPDQVLAAMSAEFEDSMTTPQIEKCIKAIESKVKRAEREITTLFVKPQTPETWNQNHPAG